MFDAGDIPHFFVFSPLLRLLSGGRRAVTPGQVFCPRRAIAVIPFSIIELRDGAGKRFHAVDQGVSHGH